ncbi:hypothetical protein QDA00_gp93 [Microbacterium phage Matzah]|uniref:Uncharacterized protein n=1 Tax=Microbacterium phage Matzah TaxID=2686228 RepID=A0A6B9L6I8_9CAUD|nr:hypothetical protein QDA00_gp93 [Microbacterium phage Matzah]QHB37010.1 hypothetical protein SEA_MATZAH_17 [Microbacterium phage Matzah]
MSRILYPLPTHSAGYVVERAVHPVDECDECREWAEACALVGQANGGGYVTNTSPDGYTRFHGASVIRDDLAISTRRPRTCEIRQTTVIESPLCGLPAIGKRHGEHWACAEHLGVN